MDVLQRSGALLGRNHDTIFFDAKRVPRSIDPRRLCAHWLRHVEEPEAVAVFDDFVGERKGALCARINAELLGAAQPLRPGGPVGELTKERFPFCDELQALLARVPMLKEPEKARLEAVQRELVAEASQAFEENLDEFASELLNDADRHEAALARAATPVQVRRKVRFDDRTHGARRQVLAQPGAAFDIHEQHGDLPHALARRDQRAGGVRGQDTGEHEAAPGRRGAFWRGAVGHARSIRESRSSRWRRVARCRASQCWPP
ncbi:MAG TPA: hypothetical protein VNE59_10165 [Burkholderiales bacterium]|nr:hypothetical protein [Burkholderiales bacterium]